MRSLVLLFLFVRFITPALHAQGDWVWANAPTSNPFDHGESITTDASGNSYVAGSFAAYVTFGSVTLNTSNGQSFYVVKFDASGNAMWGKCAMNSPNSQSRSVTVDSSGNVYVAGIFDGPFLRIGTDTIFNTGANNSRDIFLCKFDPLGNLIWLRGGDGNRTDDVGDIAISGNGDCYVAGLFFGPFITFGSDTLYNSNYQSLTCDLFLARFDPAGNQIWLRGVDSTSGSEVAASVALDQNGDIIVTGSFTDTIITFDTNLLVNRGGEDIFLAKYDTSGNVIWAKSFGGSSTEIVDGLCVDIWGNICISGEFTSDTMIVDWLTAANTDTAGNYLDVFVAKFNTNGIPYWVQRTGGMTHDKAYSMCTDQLGNIFVCGGTYSESFSFASTIVTNADSSGVNQDIFLFRYDANGNEIWIEFSGGADDDMARDVTCDQYNAVYMTGVFESQAITLSPIVLNNPSTGSMNHTFIAKLEDPTTIEEVTSPELSVYPNPATDGIFTITYSAPISEIIIYDLHGRIVSQKQNPGTSIDISSQEPGLYCITILTPAGVFSRKIVYLKN